MMYNKYFVLFTQVVWTLSQAAAVTAASALICVAASVRKVGPAKTALSLAAQTTAPARGCASKESACVTETLEGTTVPSRGAPQTARGAGCVSMGSVCARSPSLVKTAWSGGVSMTAQIRGCVSTGRASVGLGMWERTARWCTVPTTAATREFAKRVSVSARRASLEMTAILVGWYFFTFL